MKVKKSESWTGEKRDKQRKKCSHHKENCSLEKEDKHEKKKEAPWSHHLFSLVMSVALCVRVCVWVSGRVRCIASHTPNAAHTEKRTYREKEKK